ncbi:MAG TPA: hypothetical protein VLH08_17395 [Acidobacteriota bacterium]|nr:hypothetical protein [Acidobacteriota bacterium]
MPILLLFAAQLYASNDKVSFIYYYPWYASADYDGRWAHWEEYNHQPPYDISSSFYPKLGTYSSQNPQIIDQHMRWISRTGIHVVIYSWWGRDDDTHHNATSVLDAATKYGLKLAFLIEPYVERTPRRICDDIDFLEDRFGKHPAFFRMNWPNNQKPSRSLFFIYDPDYSDGALRNMMKNLHETTENPIVLLHTTDASMLKRTNADGIFSYEAYQPVEMFYPGIVNEVRKQSGIFVPSVSPGFNINGTYGEKSAMFRSRRDGKTYDHWWEAVLASDADYVAVISFNEWHEGTQIEPATDMKMPVRGYLNYEGAYGLTGVEAERSYLRRTARWIQLFLQK